MTIENTEVANEGEDTSTELDQSADQGEQSGAEFAAGSGLALTDEQIMSANSPEEYAALLAAAGAKVQPEPVDHEGDEGKDEAGEEGDKPDEAAESAAEGAAKDGEPAKKDAESDKDAEKSTEQDKEAVVDYAAEYKRLMAPFNANGREIQVKSVDDAISLMQQGANYHKKMAALRPNLKLMKMLESSGFMSEEQVGFLIDLGKKDPAAINKLISESGISPMDLDPEKASGYKQTTFAASDVELDLDTVLEEISGSPSYGRTLNVVGQQWDAASKRQVAEQPAIFKVINTHMELGIYDQIEKEVVSERLFGRLSGLTDIEAYRQVGDAMEKAGKFNSAGSSPKKQEPAPVIVTPTPKKVDDDKLKEKRRAASSTKPVATTPAKDEVNPLSLSDEEFTKLMSIKFR